MHLSISCITEIFIKTLDNKRSLKATSFGPKYFYVLHHIWQEFGSIIVNKAIDTY